MNLRPVQKLRLHWFTEAIPKVSDSASGGKRWVARVGGGWGQVMSVMRNLQCPVQSGFKSGMQVCDVV